MKWKLEITMESMLLPGSGGGSAVIDTEIVHDIQGIPYLPGRRMKGLLRESAAEVAAMCRLAGVAWLEDSEVEQVFAGAEAQVMIRDCRIREYEEILPWLAWFGQAFPGVVQRQSVLDWFSGVRQQTALKEGVAKESSLRNSRVIDRMLVFEGVVESKVDSDIIGRVLALACANLRRMGTMRNRGFGEISCRLINEAGLDEVAVQLANCRREGDHV